MPSIQTLSEVVNLLAPDKNTIFGMTCDEAEAIVAAGDVKQIAKIDGQFAIVARDGINVRMVRTIGRLVRYFIAKLEDGPVLVVSDRIDAIRDWLQDRGLAGQFHPSYTRMVPAHHLVNLRLVGCPDPNPTYERFFTPSRASSSPDIHEISTRYIRAVYDDITKWLQTIPQDAPVGVCFSGGIDSGSVFLLAYHAMLKSGMNPSRLKAFTLVVDQGGEDLAQARAFLKELDLELFLEPLEVSRSDIDLRESIKVIEDYKPLDIQAGAMTLSLCRAIRKRYPDWKYLLDGDGGDENLKDYPIEENPELTIRSVVNNLMLYQEGWGVEAIKHSLTYSGGLSRGYARTYAPTAQTGFISLSPYALPNVIAVAEAIPFAELTKMDHEKLYRLKGEIVSHGVHELTGMRMPVFSKRRFQHGAVSGPTFDSLFPSDPVEYRQIFHEVFESAAYNN